MEATKHYSCKNCGKPKGEHRAYSLYCPERGGFYGFSSKLKFEPDFTKKPILKTKV